MEKLESTEGEVTWEWKGRVKWEIDREKVEKKKKGGVSNGPGGPQFSDESFCVSATISYIVDFSDSIVVIRLSFRSEKENNDNNNKDGKDSSSGYVGAIASGSTQRSIFPFIFFPFSSSSLLFSSFPITVED